MTKPLCVFQAPIATRSGYGDMCRGIARHLIELDMFDLKIAAVPWGMTPQNALDATNPLHQEILSRLVQPGMKIDRPLEVFIHATIPNEFTPTGKINIGITAGIETNMCSEQWVQGANRMTTVWGISNHAVNSIKDTVVTKKDQHGNVTETVTAKVPFEVLHNFVDTTVFKKINPEEVPQSVNDILSQVEENFCFLFVGQWVKGGYGEDRKNIGVLIKTFCDTFRTTPQSKRPALILKTSGADFSILDREETMRKIKEVKNMCGFNPPNVYLIHGDLTEEEMNGLYNHPKIKAHVSFTKGEGFGRPLLEATMSEKPVIVSGWGGHTDFLNVKDALLLAGELKQIEPGAVWENILIPQSLWFNVDTGFAEKALKKVFKEHDSFMAAGKRMAKKNMEAFNSEVIKEQLKQLLEKYVPNEVLHPPQVVDLKLPNFEAYSPSMELPQLKLVDPNK